MSSRQSVHSLPATWQQLVVEETRAKHMRRRIRRRVAATPDLNPIASADVAGLHYVDDTALPGIRRVNRGKRYLDHKGRVVVKRDVLQRIASLAIPPAWRDVWICPTPLGHLQATGRDARGRKQYRYHARWREVRDEVKYGRLMLFARALPRIRKRASADLRRPGLPREKVLAAVVQLLEKTLIRIGNDEYARENHSFGLTTLRDKHATVNGTSVRFEFRGKSGISHSVDLHDARLARVVKSCRDLPGQELFQYLDADNHRHTIGSADVNAYLRDISGEAFTAKDFRTWAGTVLAAEALSTSASFRSTTEAKRIIVGAVECVAKQLGNTKAVCRKSYIHPAILDAYMDRQTIPRPTKRAATVGPGTRDLTSIETAVVAIIRQRGHARS